MRHIAIIPKSGLGDTAVAMPAVKWYHEHGYRTIVFVNDKLTTAFNALNFIDKLIPVKVPFARDLESQNQLDELQDRLINTVLDTMKLCDGDVCFAAPTSFIWSGKVKQQISQHISLVPDAKTNEVGNLCYEALAIMGIEPFHCKPIFGFHRTLCPINKKGYNIGICHGSYARSRRLSPLLMNRLCEQLNKLGRVYLFGTTKDGEDKCSYPVYKNFVEHEKYQLPVAYTLTCMEKMDVFITPDSGLCHAAAFFDIPTIALISVAIPDVVFTGDKNNISLVAADDNLLTCKKDCNYKIYEKQGEVYRLPFAHLACYNEQKYSVQCLDKIDVSNIVELVRQNKQATFSEKISE